jgi:hypothetical protein
MPDDPMEATRSALASRGADMAARSAQSAFIRTAKGYLPRWAWPLIPGAGGSVADNLKANASRTIWGWVGGCVFTLFFAAAVGVVLAFVGGVVLYAFATS